MSYFEKLSGKRGIFWVLTKTIIFFVVSMLVIWTIKYAIAPVLFHIDLADPNAHGEEVSYTLIPAMVCLFIPYWYLASRLLRTLFDLVFDILLLQIFRKKHIPSSHGTASFASPKIIKLFKIDDGIIIGRDKGKLLRYSGPSHLLTVAPTRAGKGVSAIIPNLLILNRPVICIDPKGENTRITAMARKKFGPVHVVDPFAISGERASGFNPLSLLDENSDDLVEDAMTLAEAVVFDPPDQVREAHWNEAARSLVSGILLYVVTQEKPENRTLGRLREYLTLAPNQFRAFLNEMSGINAAHGAIKKAANSFLGKDPKEASGVLSTAHRHTHFLDAPRIARSLEQTNFDLMQTLNKNGTVFLVLPPDKLETYNRWLRLILTQMLRQLISAQSRPEQSVLFIMDEFAALGRMETIERAVALVAGYGIQLWPIVQDLSQLKSIYGSRGDTFLANAGVFQAFNVRDLETAEFISRMLGSETISFETFSQSSNSDGEVSETVSLNITGRSLLNSDEVISMRPDRQLLFVQSVPPIIADKVTYYEDKEFVGLFAIY